MYRDFEIARLSVGRFSFVIHAFMLMMLFVAFAAGATIAVYKSSADSDAEAQAIRATAQGVTSPENVPIQAVRVVDVPMKFVTFMERMSIYIFIMLCCLLAERLFTLGGWIYIRGWRVWKPRQIKEDEPD